MFCSQYCRDAVKMETRKYQAITGKTGPQFHLGVKERLVKIRRTGWPSAAWRRFGPFIRDGRYADVNTSLLPHRSYIIANILYLYVVMARPCHRSCWPSPLDCFHCHIWKLRLIIIPRHCILDRRPVPLTSLLDCIQLWAIWHPYPLHV